METSQSPLKTELKLYTFTLFAFHSTIDPFPYYIGYDTTPNIYKPRKSGKFTLVSEHWKKCLGTEHVHINIFETGSELQVHEIFLHLVYTFQQIGACWTNPEVNPQYIDFSLIPEPVTTYKNTILSLQVSPLMKQQREHIHRKVLSRIKTYEGNRERNRINRNNPSPGISLPIDTEVLESLRTIAPPTKRHTTPVGRTYTEKEANNFDPRS